MTKPQWPERLAVCVTTQIEVIIAALSCANSYLHLTLLVKNDSDEEINL